LNLIPSKDNVSNAFFQSLDTKGFQKESILQMSPIVMELSYIFHLYFSLEKPISGKGLIFNFPINWVLYSNSHE
jgi:hypothetical protein